MNKNKKIEEPKYYHVKFVQLNNSFCESNIWLTDKEIMDLMWMIETNKSYLITGNPSHMVVNMKYVQSILFTLKEGEYHEE